MFGWVRMRFGDILNEWESRTAIPGGLDKAAEAEERLRRSDAEAKAGRKPPKRSDAQNSLIAWLDEYGTEDKDSEGPAAVSEREREAENRRLRDLRPQARLDLHGQTAEDAEKSIEAFLEGASRSGLEKVLVVTGKGVHSKGEPVLGKTARRVLEASPFAGRFGTAAQQDGGSGALWVLIRKESYFSR